MKKLTPLNENVVLDITHELKEEKTPSGLIIPGQVKRRNKTAEVVAVSENMGKCKGIKVGDEILYTGSPGFKHELNNKLFLVTHYSEVLAIISE